MKKTTAETKIKSLPALISNVTNYIKDTFSIEKQKNTISNAGGSIGFLISFFGNSILDKYFDRVSENKLKDFGFHTYAKAAFKQAANSLQLLEKEETKPSLDIPALLVEKKFFETINTYDKAFTILAFQPKFHPAVLVVKNLIIDMLNTLSVDTHQIKRFQKEFNDNIEKVVEEEFGEYYGKLKQNINNVWFQENETEMLIDLINQSKIGFTEEENLKYEVAYGSWAPLSQRSYGMDDDLKKINEREKNLLKVEVLIDDYFKVEAKSHLEKILFIVADFGKGKSVFLKQYAAECAKKYLETGEGHFPVYFNLRNISSYSSDTQLGIIEDFLQTKYAIKISSDYFKSKKYLFLIDSLDESCDLSKSAVEKVISSIKRIQNIEKSVYRTNQIVITSRPFDESLFNLIANNKPFLIKKEGKDIPHYISLYGFKKEQFNDWVYTTLRRIVSEFDTSNSEDFIQQLLHKINAGEQIDIYDILLKNKTLTSSELRRPIFAYMIYQLIKNNVNITKVGKIGIYLSFLNLLSKEAKYIHDPNLKIKTQEQFEARNILHQIAALWTYERQQGKQGLLKKADICRILGGYGINLSDEIVIEEFKKTGGNDIQFLSHSYFGEDDSVLHFQHQSFAEILLAEYYVKVFIKCALDRTTDIDFVISKLKIGIPTPQTIEFFREILILLRDSSIENDSVDTNEKRNLLVPLLASISIVNNNKSLYSDQLYYQWYEKANIDKHTTEIPNILTSEWCINQGILDKIILLSEQIILSDKIFLLSKSETITSLIDKEITEVENKNYKLNLNLDKQLALIVGNALFNQKNKYFIQRFDFNRLYPLIKFPNEGWLNSEFKGIRIESKQDSHFRPVLSLRFYQIDLTDSVIQNLIFSDSTFYNCNFKNAIFQDVIFADTDILDCDFSSAKLNGLVDFTSVIFDNTMQLPTSLIKKIYKTNKN